MSLAAPPPTTTPPARPRVASVTVAYQPEVEPIRRQLAALEPQVDDIIVVDNGGFAAIAPALGACRAGLVATGGNIGVAAGFNAGIDEARRRGARYVVLFDQDSVPAPDMVALLMEALPSVDRAAAAGPHVRDLRDRTELPFVRIGAWRNPKHFCGAGKGRVACDFLISSGALIDLEAFDAVGRFDESLFIDSVDLEWCLRARSKGYQLIGCCDAMLEHRLGDHRVRVARVLELVIHPPERLYYMTRNRVMLYRRAYMPWGWKWKDAMRATLKCLALTLLVAPRAQYARMAWRGMVDALANRGGKRVEP